MNFKFKGRVFKFKDNIDTDRIIPAAYLTLTDPKRLAEHLMEGVSPNFYSLIREGDIIVAGKNFGCGSSREHAVLAIKGAGIACVIAESFARIFFRNAINRGLLVISLSAAGRIPEFDTLIVDIEEHYIESTTLKQRFEIPKYPPFLVEIIKEGGLLEYLKRRGHLTG